MLHFQKIEIKILQFKKLNLKKSKFQILKTKIYS